jgi:phage gp45-like
MERMIKNLIKRGILTLVLPDNAPATGAQVVSLGDTTDTETVYPYGLSANAPAGSEAILFNIMGDESNKVALIYSPQTRFSNLQAGEVAVGNQIIKSHIKFDQNGNIEIVAPKDLNVTITGNVNLIVNGNVNVTAETTTLTGDVNLGGTGGVGVARIGDSVVDGVITTGSSTVRSL